MVSIIFNIIVIINNTNAIKNKSERHIKLITHKDHLNISFENDTRNLLRIWEFDNSWGWNTISIEIKKEHNPEIFIVRKLKKMGWTKNGPTYFEVKPHEKKIIEIFPSSQWWESENDLSSLKNQKILVRALVHISETPESIMFDVFTGKLQSDWVESTPPHNWLFSNE